MFVYRGADGKTVPVKSVEDWVKRRAEVVRGMESVMGKLPGEAKRCPLDMKIEEDVDCETYVRRLVTYASEPGGRDSEQLVARRMTVLVVGGFEVVEVDVHHRHLVGHAQRPLQGGDRGGPVEAARELVVTGAMLQL